MKRWAAVIVGLLLVSACQDLRQGPTGPVARPGTTTPGKGPSTAPRAAVTAATVSRADTINFASYTTGTQPTGWSQMWVPSPFWTAADEPAALDGKVLQWSA